jgi:hypothetical protein
LRAGRCFSCVILSSGHLIKIESRSLLKYYLSFVLPIFDIYIIKKLGKRKCFIKIFFGIKNALGNLAKEVGFGVRYEVTIKDKNKRYRPGDCTINNLFHSRDTHVDITVVCATSKSKVDKAKYKVGTLIVEAEKKKNQK